MKYNLLKTHKGFPGGSAVKNANPGNMGSISGLGRFFGEESGSPLRLLRVPWTARRSNQSILEEINPEYSLEWLMLKLQYFGHLIWRAHWLGKTLMAGKDWRQEEKRTTEDEMVVWHHWLNGHEFEQTQRDSEGQGSLAFCSPWARKELDMSEWLNNKDYLK